MLFLKWVPVLWGEVWVLLWLVQGHNPDLLLSSPIFTSSLWDTWPFCVVLPPRSGAFLRLQSLVLFIFKFCPFGFPRKPLIHHISDLFSVVTHRGHFSFCRWFYLLSKTPRILFSSLPVFKVSDLTSHIDVGSRGGVTGFEGQCPYFHVAWSSWHSLSPSYVTIMYSFICSLLVDLFVFIWGCIERFGFRWSVSLQNPRILS